jgi:hypothetical protein
MSDERENSELDEQELDKINGGFTITKIVDKASPVLREPAPPPPPPPTN